MDTIFFSFYFLLSLLLFLQAFGGVHLHGITRNVTSGDSIYTLMWQSFGVHGGHQHFQKLCGTWDFMGNVGEQDGEHGQIIREMAASA